jgi:hypothetical protein
MTLRRFSIPSFHTGAAALWDWPAVAGACGLASREER